MAQLYEITCPRCRDIFRATTGPNAQGGGFAHCDKCYQEVVVTPEEYQKPYIEQNHIHKGCEGRLHYSSVYCPHCGMEVTSLEMDKLGTIVVMTD